MPMAQSTPKLPLNADGVCMVCHVKPPEEVTLICVMCATPWHVDCLPVPPESMASALKFECPDCTGDGMDGAPAPVDSEKKDLFARIREIEADVSLSETEKARRRQELLSGKVDESTKGKEKMDEEGEEKSIDILKVLGESFKCSYCMELPEKPVTTPCRHNFCLKCFEKWINQGKTTCVKCRHSIPRKLAVQPRINSTLVSAIRIARLSRTITSGGTHIAFRYVHNQDRPDTAYTTERAQKPGMANAASGRVFVSSPRDHFGPISAVHDPERNRGVLVGDTYSLRLEVRQWGLHYPPVAGISGRALQGAQSIVISGGYEDDEDHGEWFIYTGSGGRDLTGNKRTNDKQSSDQEFKDTNQALRLSCEKGYPVRVVRSEKDKRSPYAPEEGYRYDGVHRVEICWRNRGKQGFLVCRYLLVRCDNEPAPWTSNEHGDRPRRLPVIQELKQGAIDIYQRIESPSWDYDEEEECWKWKKQPPPSEVKVVPIRPEELEKATKGAKKAQMISMKEKLLQGFKCLLCKEVMRHPVTTPCAHNFCKPCLESKFLGQSFENERVCANGRKLRSQRNVMTCPECPTDISDFLKNLQVNRELMEVIEKLQDDVKKDKSQAEGSSSEETNLGKENNDSMPEEADAPNCPPAEGHQANPLKRKSATPIEHEGLGSNLPAAKLRGRPKGGASKCNRSEKAGEAAADGLKTNEKLSNGSQVAPTAKRRGRPKKEVPKDEPTTGTKAEAAAEDGGGSPSSPLQLHSTVPAATTE